MPKKTLNNDLVADLTWAELYAAKIKENLKILISAVKKTPTRNDLIESTTLLRQQLESANRTIGELSEIILRAPIARSVS